MSIMMRKVGVLVLTLCVCTAFAPLLSGGVTYGKSLKINKKTVYLTKGKKAKLKAKGARKAKWASSNTSVATVSKKGKVTAKGIGVATITATAKGKTAKSKVIVMDKAAKKAKALRDTIYKKKGHKITMVVDQDSDTSTTVTIKAFKGNTKLLFDFDYMSDNSDGGKYMDMTIDLVSMTTGKASLKYYPDGYYQFYDANLERTFQSDGKDVAVTRITVITEGENGEETEYPKPTIEDNEKVGNGIHTTFDSFDKLLKKKAKGYTMRKIGFIG